MRDQILISVFRYNTPIPALVVTTIGGASLTQLSFSSLIQLQSLVYGVVVIVICSSAIKLRISDRHKSRPYKILNSDSLLVVSLVAVGPILLSLYIIVTVCMANWIYAALAIMLWLLFFIWHGLCGIRNEWNAMNAPIPRPPKIVNDDEDENDASVPFLGNAGSSSILFTSIKK